MNRHFLLAAIGALALLGFAASASAQPAQNVPTACKPTAGAVRECVSRLPAPWTYGYNTCNTPIERSSEAESLSDEIANDWGGSTVCNLSTIRNGWITTPRTVGYCGNSGTQPLFMSGIEISNTSNYTFNWEHCTTHEPMTSSNNAVKRRRDLYCPSGYTWGGNYCYTDNSDVDRSKNLGKPCPGCGNPINPQIGNKFQEEVDYEGSGSFPLRFVRYYNSAMRVTNTETGHYGVGSFTTNYGNQAVAALASGDGGEFFSAVGLDLIGANWRHSYQAAIALIEGSAITTAHVFRPDGRVLIFNLHNGAYHGAADVQERLERLPDNSWKLTTPENEVETYSEFGRLISRRNRAGATQTLTYDTCARLATVSPLSRNTANQYDELSRLKQINDAGAGVTKFTYDALDNLTSVTDPRNKVTSYSNTAFGEVKQLVSPDTGTTVNTYDSGGNLATTTDARSKTGTYGYDALNRVTSLAYPDRTIGFTYDFGTNGVGRLTGASDADHSLSWTYDTQGRVAGRTQTVGAITKSVSYGYTNGNLTSLVTPSGQTIAYGYTDGRVTSVTLNGSTTILNQVLYEPFGPVRQWTWGNSTITNRTFDLDGNPSAVDSEGAATYTLDDAFRITGVTDLVDSTRSWTYGYDLLDRLTSATRTGQTIGFTYDANGNRLTQTGTTTATYTVSTTNNRITSIAGTPARTYAYDAAGNTTGDGSLTYGYQDSGRMSSVTSGGVTTGYTLNALGQRVRKSNASATRLFMYDEAGHLVGEYDGAGALVQETVWMGDIPVATLRPDGAGVAVLYVHTDHLNTPRRLSRPSDNVVVWRWNSDPFGTDEASEDPDGDSTVVSFNLRYPGQYFDDESGLSYNYYRDWV